MTLAPPDPSWVAVAGGPDGEAARAQRRARRDLEDAVFAAVRSRRKAAGIRITRLDVPLGLDVPGALDGIDVAAVAAETGCEVRDVPALAEGGRRRGAEPTIADLGLAIADELAAGDEDFALRLVRTIVARVESAQGDDLQRLLAEPPRIGEQRWDTLVAGAVAWTCHRRGLDAPRWTRVPSLTRFWHVRPQPALRALLIQQTPSELAVLGVWLDANSLRSV